MGASRSRTPIAPAPPARPGDGRPPPAAPPASPLTRSPAAPAAPQERLRRGDHRRGPPRHLVKAFGPECFAEYNTGARARPRPRPCRAPSAREHALKPQNLTPPRRPPPRAGLATFYVGAAEAVKVGTPIDAATLKYLQAQEDLFEGAAATDLAAADKAEAEALSAAFQGEADYYTASAAVCFQADAIAIASGAARAAAAAGAAAVFLLL
jgi:hypothetical protein